MIDYIRGEIVELTPAFVTLECSGLGYLVNISLNTYTALNSQKSAKVYIYEAIREDAYTLYGFAERHERDVFMLLISVSGVGPATARVMLSSLNSKELEMAIATENVALLQSVKGIGAKTAQRIIVDLKDKIKPGEDSEVVSLPVGTTFSNVVKEAVSALVMLGFSQNNSRKVVTKIVKEFPALSVEAVIKEALKRL